MTLLRLGPDRVGLRLDQAVQDALQKDGISVSTSEIKQALRSGRIRVDGRRRAPGSRVRGDETVDFTHWRPSHQQPVEPRPDLLSDIQVVARGPDWVVLDKPSGLPTLPGRHPHGPSLLAAAVAYDRAILQAGPPGEGGAVHRLDNGASGAVLFATTSGARQSWRDAFRRHQVEKVYLAQCAPAGRQVLQGERLRMSGQVETTGGPKVRFHPGPGPASEVMIRWVGATSLGVQVHTRTGQRHQVRVHLAALGLPIADDPLYGPDPQPEARRRPFRLHAWKLRWAQVSVQTSLPPWEAD